MDWTAVGAIATCVLAGGIGFAIWQIREARRSTNAEVAVDLFEDLRNAETVEKLRSIYDLESDDFKCLPSDKKKEIDYVLDRFEMLGALTLNKIIDKKLAIETYAGPPALRCWYKLCHYVREEQETRGYYVENYELFVRLCLDYFKKANVRVMFYKKGKEDEGIDLLTELEKNQLSPRSTRKIKREREGDNQKRSLKGRTFP
jgi:hypothetical protein